MMLVVPTVEVRLFAHLRERAGAPTVTLELPDPATVGDVLAAMGVGPKECVAAVNREYAGPETAVAAGDEVALVPPVSGGASPVRLARITGEPLDVATVA